MKMAVTHSGSGGATNAPSSATLFDIGDLPAILENFTHVTGLAASLVDRESQQILISTGWQDICTNFHRAHPESCAHCREDNRQISHAMKTPGETHITRCHAGLAIGATPFYANGRHVADIFIGQALFELPDREEYRRRAIHYGYHVPDYLSALDKLRIVSVEHFQNALQLLGAQANQAAEANIRNVQLASSRDSLQNKLEFTQSLLDAIPYPVYYKDANGHYIGANREFCDFCGKPREAILGRTAREVLSHKQAEPHERADLELLFTRKPQLYESSETLPSGETRDYLFCKSLFSGEGCPTTHCIAGAMLDISERKRAEEGLRLAAKVFECAAEGIIITDAAQRIVNVNDAFTRLTGYAREDVIGRTPAILQSGHHDAAFYRAMQDQLQRTGVWQGEIWNRRLNGETYPEWLAISTVRDDKGKIQNYIGIFTDITHVKDAQRCIEFLANHDPLTELPNRNLFSDRLQQALRRAERRNGQLAVMFIDLDNFKGVNDSYGHDMGDRLLKQAAGRLRGCLREEDTAARMGGDEFTVVLEGQQAHATLTAQRIIETLSSPYEIDGYTLTVTASLGISRYPEDGHTVQALLKAADSAMYRAKECGKNNYTFYGEGGPVA